MKEVFVTCPGCGGSGGNYVSREMAIDAGEMGMEGTEISCSNCVGAGEVPREVSDEKALEMKRIKNSPRAPREIDDILF